MPTADNQIENEAYNAKYHRPKVVEALKKAGQKGATKAQLINQTGFSMYQIEDALRDLMGQFHCRLEVDKNTGELSYHFDLTSLRNRQSILAKIRQLLVFTIEFVFKLWITLMLFTFGLFYGAIAALLITGLSKNPNVILVFIGGYFWALYELFKSIGNYFQRGAKAAQQFNPKNLLHLVFAYVFGKRRENDAYQTEKIILDYLAKNQYQLTKTELIMITGWSMQQVEDEILQLIINYRGEPIVSEEGVIVYTFPEISISQLALIDTTVEETAPTKKYWVWDRRPELPKWGIGESSFVIGIVMILGSLFSIGYSVFAVPAAPDFWRFSYVSYIPIMDRFFISFWTSYFSLAFCAAFYIFHFYYKRKWQRKNYRIEKRFANALYLQNIFSTLDGLPHSQLTKKDAKSLEYWRVELGGNPENSADGTVISRFEQQITELKAIAKLRNQDYNSLIPETSKSRNYRYETKRNAIVGLFFIVLISGLVIGPILWFNFLEDVYLRITTSKQSAALALQFSNANLIVDLELDYPPNDRYYKLIVDRNIARCQNLKKLTINGAPKITESLMDCQMLEYLHLKNMSNLNRYEFRGINDIKNLRILISADNGALLSELHGLDSLKVLRIDDASNYEQSNTSGYSPFTYFAKNADSITVINLHVNNLRPNKIRDKSWKYLNLSNLSADYAISGTGKLDSLKTLILNGMKQAELDWVAAYNNLEELHCKDCAKVSRLPKDIDSLQNLRYLDISGTAITELDESMKGLKALDILILDKELKSKYERELKKWLPKAELRD